MELTFNLYSGMGNTFVGHSSLGIIELGDNREARMRDVEPDKLSAAQMVDQDKAELNNNNNNQKVLHCIRVDSSGSSSSILSTSSIESIDDSIDSSKNDRMSVGTWRRRRIAKDKAVSLKQGNEMIGLENVIPRHRSLKALAEMGK